MRRTVAGITACAVALMAASPLLGGAQEIASSTVLLQQDRGRPASPLDRHVTVHLADVSLGQALRTLEALGAVRVSFSSDIVPVTKQVSVDLDDGTLREAFRRVLDGTGLGVLVQAGDHLVLVKAPRDPAQGGTVTGRVTDAKSGKAIPNVSVYLVGTRWRVTTGEDGTYHLTEVAPGTYTLAATRIGYTKQSQSVTVAAGQDLMLDLALQAAATELEQVVVTGTVVPTERKAIPTPITVISGDEIEQKGYQRVDQIFRGDIPGAIAWNNDAANSYYSDINIRGANGIFANSTVKTYIDGVEVAVPTQIATIDPSSIERIEVLRGPQGSTLYGSNALAGVMEIFTKRGPLNTLRPQVEAQVSTGVVESPWADNALQQDYRVAVTGGGSSSSYRVGVGYSHQGEWVPEYYTNNASLNGALQETQGPVTIELSGRYYDKAWGQPLDPRFAQAGYTYYSKPLDESEILQQQTYGLSLKYAPTTRWQHSLALGYDLSSFQFYFNHPRFTTPSDSLLLVSSSYPRKASVAYNSTYEFALGRSVRSSLTAGADFWSYDQGGFYAGNTTSNSNTVPSPNFGYRYHYHNTGYFAQEQLGLRDVLFLTAGVRAENSPNFGRDFGLAWAPRVGVSYIQGFGDVTLKGRFAYGKAIRPPFPGEADAVVTAYTDQLANPNLGPEGQAGLDGGLELYVGSRGSLEVTYYNQKADGLIDYVLVNGSATPPQFQFQNVGRIKNTGWEFQGRVRSGRLSLTGTYSITSSVVQQLSATYGGDLQVGDRMLHIPRHTAGATLSYKLRGSAVSLGMTYVSSWTDYDWVAFWAFNYGGQPYRGSLRDYWITYPAFAKLNVSVSQVVTDRLSVFVQSNNLTNSHAYERDNINLTPGRSTLLGIRTRF